MMSAASARILILVTIVAVGIFVSVSYFQDHLYTHIEAVVDARLNLTRNVPLSAVSKPPEVAVEHSEDADEFKHFRDVFISESEPRKDYINTMYSNHKNKINTKKGIGLLYNVLAPEVHCPLKVRIGNVEDGGKWVCNPFRMPKSNCQVYSLGINQEISFDTHLQTLTNNICKLHAYDMSPQPPAILNQLKAINGDFKVARLSGTTNAALNQYSIVDLMKEHGDKLIEILKIDIEGSEFEVMPQIFQTTSVCQVLIEMHKSLIEVIELLKAFSKAGFYLFSYETNGYDYKVSEYSFIHKDCMERYGAILLAQYLQKKKR